MNVESGLGSYVVTDRRPAVRFQRDYPYPIERVWTAITDPGELAHWFPAPEITIDGRVGGTITFAGDPHLDGSTGTIVRWQPPTELAFTWGADELRFQLEATDANSCRLVLINILDQGDAAARNAAGWWACLNELARALAGAPGDGPHSAAAAELWPDSYAAHVAAGLPHGAEIPT
jgi:uncharacterized protein YndB with AHSA1/START domain